MHAMGPRKLTKILVPLMIIVFGLCLAVSLYSQVTGATLSGNISDSSGGVIAGAQISINNTATGISKDFQADSAGYYSAPNLAPGTYEVKVTAAGFNTTVSTVTLAVGAQQQLNIPMKVGETSQTIQVTGAAPQIELTSSTLSGQVESQTVLDLPLNGRDWTSLATLQPGVNLIETQIAYGDSGRGNRGFGAELTISGQRTTTNNYRLDGVSVNDYANSGPGNVIGAALGVDAIQEFSVLTGGFSAEYGKAAGGVINAITKSGTNSFHGDLYEFIRNSALDSRDYFSRSGDTPLAQFRRNQFGGSAGGPIIKDKTFIFGDYEGMRQAKGITSTIKIPSLNARQGILASGAIVPVDPAATAMFRMYPSPTPGTTNGDSAQYINSALQIVPENFYTFRVDHKLSMNDSLSGTYLFDDTDFTEPDSFNNDILNSHTRRQTVVLQESHTFRPNLVNAARVGYSRTHVINLEPAGAVNVAATDKTLGSTSGQNAPEIQIDGAGNRMPGGVGTPPFSKHAYNSFQYYDDAFWTHGAHTLKFGGGIERMQYNFEAFFEPGGLWRFHNITDFLTNNPYHFEAGIPRTNTPRELRQTLFGAYVQDDWRVRSNVTLNIGLRYEMVTVVKDAQGKISNLLNISDPAPQCAIQYTTPNFPAYPGTTCSSVGPYYLNPTKRNLEPRIGFAWDPFRDGKTSVRGGFGIYDVLPLPGYFLVQEQQAAPFMIFSSVDSPACAFNSPPTCSNPLAGHFSSGGENLLVNPPPGVSPGRLATSTVEHSPHRNYVEEWNLNLQRQITPTLSLMMGYVGSHGVHNLIRGDDGNMTYPTQTSEGLLFPCGPPIQPDGTCTAGNNAAGNNGQVNQTLGTIRYAYWGTDSSYNALNVNVDKKMSHGLQFGVSYTWGKSLDESSSTIAGDTFSQSLNSLFYFAPKSLRGPSDFNVAHTLAINALWVVPTPQSWSGFARTAAGGWQLGGIVKYNSGVPTTPIIAGDPMGLGNSGADQFGIPNLIPGCDPINHNFIGGNSPIYINSSCYTLPTVSASSPLAAQCAPFTGGSDGPVPAPPAGQVYCSNLLGNAGRNSITGPNLVNVDFSMTKNTAIKRISETFNVQFRAEIFNIFNHSNFVPPEPVSASGGAALFNQDGSSAGAGQIDSLATQPRDVQFALKVIW
jgi:Carboxypeptidase regulatory-like domain/TonB-dependent Receptor Plug Domain